MEGQYLRFREGAVGSATGDGAVAHSVQDERGVVAGAEVLARALFLAELRHDAPRQSERDRVIGIDAEKIAGEAPRVLNVAASGQEPERIRGQGGVVHE